MVLVVGDVDVVVDEDDGVDVDVLVVLVVGDVDVVVDEDEVELDVDEVVVEVEVVGDGEIVSEDPAVQQIRINRSYRVYVLKLFLEGGKFKLEMIPT